MNKFEVIALPHYFKRTQIYRQLSSLPGFVLLESSDNATGDYDIVTAFPYDSLTFEQGIDIKEAMQLLQQRIISLDALCDLPFQGGAIGYFSYEWGACSAGVPVQDLSIPLLQLQFYDWALICLHQSQKMVLFVANRISDTRYHIDRIMACIESKCVSSQAEGRLTSPFIPQESFDSYKNAFQSIQADLEKGRCYQVNYTQRFTASFEGSSWGIYEQLREANPVPFAAFMRLNQSDIISCSPERLLLHDNGLLETSPIKGTIGRSFDFLEDEQLKQQLMKSEKDIAENVMIVDLLRNDLGKIAKPGSVSVEGLCEVKSFPAVHHLVSTIRAVLGAQYSPLDAFLAVFPGGSITGAPKRESMFIIHELEREPRGVYCGSIGYFSNHGRFDFNIAIRTMLAKEGNLYLSAGGALVIDSVLNKEYQECFTKIKAIADGLL